MSKAKAANQNTNKDLSCLRCRKKKAKCSKTRPTCTRCERSNHPCEYPDAPPNLTDLSKKVLDLYDSLKDLEGEFLFKYIQQSTTTDNEDNENEDIEQDNNNDEPTISPILLPSSLPSPPPPPLSINGTDINNKTFPTTESSIDNTNDNDNMIITTTDKKDVTWSMSYLPDGISIHATTHNMLEFLQFIDKFTRQCIYDFGMDSLSSYWDLDYHQDLIMELFNQQEDGDNDHHYLNNNNHINDKQIHEHQHQQNNNDNNNNHIEDDDDDEVDDFNEDYYLVTVPIFNTSHLLHSQQQKQQHNNSNNTTPVNNKNYKSSHLSIDFQQLYSSLPSFLNYVHLKLEQYTKIKTPGVPYQILLIIEELKPYLVIPKNNSNSNNNNNNNNSNNKSKNKNRNRNNDDENNMFINQLSMMYILSSYLICKRIEFITNDQNNDDDDPLPSIWTEADLYYHLKLLVVDIVLQITPTYAACLSVLLLIWYNSLQNTKEMDHYLIDFAWQMFKYLTQYPLKSVENHIISASLIYLDIYATIFRYYHTSISTSSHFFQELGIQLKSRIQLLCNDIHKTTSTSIAKMNGDDKGDPDILYKKQFVFIILESQLMLFLQQVLEIFYLNEDNNNNDDDNLVVRKIDVDDVLTLVRDLEQWEQQLPSWATANNNGKTDVNKDDVNDDDNNIIKIKIEDEEKIIENNNNNNNNDSNDRVTNMILELHLTLHFIKILLFRPFCTEFKDHGIEQTYTKTTFLDLSIHSADKISDYLILLDQQEEKKKKNQHHSSTSSTSSYYDQHQMRHWFFALHQIVLDVVERVRHTFNSDQDILLQLDSIVNKLESVS